MPHFGQNPRPGEYDPCGYDILYSLTRNNQLHWRPDFRGFSRFVNSVHFQIFCLSIIIWTGIWNRADKQQSLWIVCFSFCSKMEIWKLSFVQRVILASHINNVGMLFWFQMMSEGARVFIKLNISPNIDQSRLMATKAVQMIYSSNYGWSSKSWQGCEEEGHRWLIGKHASKQAAAAESIFKKLRIWNQAFTGGLLASKETLKG